ncbi:MAG TPA: hypothetical protein VFM89_09185, partial [Casimicrobiaceae bacterium]|nr:hypothetical protein [Casimicrobiaceae bacterium]
MSPLAAIVVAIAAWLAIGVLCIAKPRDLRVVRVLFPAGAIVGLVVAALALAALGDAAQTLVLPLGLPE